MRAALRLAHEGGLGELELEEPGVDAALVDDARNDCIQVALAELQRGNIHRDGADAQSGGLPAFQPARRPFSVPTRPPA